MLNYKPLAFLCFHFAELQLVRRCRPVQTVDTECMPQQAQLAATVSTQEADNSTKLGYDSSVLFAKKAMRTRLMLHTNKTGPGACFSATPSLHDIRSLSM